MYHSHSSSFLAHKRELPIEWTHVKSAYRGGLLHHLLFLVFVLSFPFSRLGQFIIPKFINTYETVEEW